MGNYMIPVIEKEIINSFSLVVPKDDLLDSVSLEALLTIEKNQSSYIKYLKANGEEITRVISTVDMNDVYHMLNGVFEIPSFLQSLTIVCKAGETPNFTAKYLPLMNITE